MWWWQPRRSIKKVTPPGRCFATASSWPPNEHCSDVLMSLIDGSAGRHWRLLLLEEGHCRCDQAAVCGIVRQAQPCQFRRTPWRRCCRWFLHGSKGPIPEIAKAVAEMRSRMTSIRAFVWERGSVKKDWLQAGAVAEMRSEEVVYEFGRLRDESNWFGHALRPGQIFDDDAIEDMRCRVLVGGLESAGPTSWRVEGAATTHGRALPAHPVGQFLELAIDNHAAYLPWLANSSTWRLNCTRIAYPLISSGQRSCKDNFRRMKHFAGRREQGEYSGVEATSRPL